MSHVFCCDYMKHWNQAFVIWLLVLASTLGSLFFSEIMKLPPCVLCWYQRILMYPLLVTVLVGMLRKDSNFIYYSWPLAALGLATAVYQNLLYYHILPESISPCSEGVSCTARQIEWLGFITIPLLALVTFAIINIIFFQIYRGIQNEKRN